MEQTSRHHGYFHFATQFGKGSRSIGSITPMMEDWTSDKAVARKQAQAMADKYGYPVVVFWCGLVEGLLSKSFRVMPKNYQPTEYTR